MRKSWGAAYVLPGARADGGGPYRLRPHPGGGQGRCARGPGAAPQARRPRGPRRPWPRGGAGPHVVEPRACAGGPRPGAYADGGGPSWLRPHPGSGPGHRRGGAGPSHAGTGCCCTGPTCTRAQRPLAAGGKQARTSWSPTPAPGAHGQGVTRQQAMRAHSRGSALAVGTKRAARACASWGAMRRGRVRVAGPPLGVGWGVRGRGLPRRGEESGRTWGGGSWGDVPVQGAGAHRPTRACRRRPAASARPSLPLPGAPDA